MKRLYIIIILFLFASCSDFLKEYSQDLAYVRSYEDLDQLLIGNGYMQVKRVAAMDLENYYYPYIHFMADETQENASIGSSNPLNQRIREEIFGYYTWQQRVGTDVQNLNFKAENWDWDMMYYHINIANMVISSADELKGATEQERQEISRVKGEACFLRAAYYFTLVNLYAKPYSPTSASTDPGVPLKLTDYIEDVKYKRNTVAEVYESVIKDLTMAEECLKGLERKSPYRGGIDAVHLLQSRVYLYMQQWDKAMFYAEQVVKGNGNLIDLNTFDPATINFLHITSVETIFSMGTNMTAANINQIVGCFGVSTDLYNAYNANEDLRVTAFFQKSSFVNCRKSTTRTGQANISDNFLFRTAEGWLNLAEAAAMSGDEAKARQALDVLRVKRIKYDKYAETDLTGKALIDHIRDERRRELCLEGHRWFDLRRYMVSEKYPYTKTIRNSYTTYKSSGSRYIPDEARIYELEPNDPAYTLPIPIEVMQYDDGIVGNPRGEREPVEIKKY